jgi:golgi to ER traffic protein 4
MSGRTGPTSSSRALEVILPLISAGQPYEAHQKARTFATRYTKSGAHAVAIDVLFQSARELLKAGHAGSGTDLAILLLDSYDRASEPVTDVSRGMGITSHLTFMSCLTDFAQVE